MLKRRCFDLPIIKFQVNICTYSYRKSLKDSFQVSQVCQDVGDEMQRNGLLPSENSSVSWFAQGLPPNLSGSAGNLQRVSALSS